MPIIDFTLKPKVEEARAFERYQEGVLKGRESLLTQRFVTSFLQAVRVAHLEESVDRVIARTQKEQEVVAQRFKEKMATVEDIENIKMALIGMQHEKRILSEQRLQYFSQIGIDPKSKVSFALANSSKLDLPRPVGSMELRSPHTVMLQAEIDALKSKGEAVSGEDKPRLSLYGLMQHDDAGGSQFGPERRLNGYEAGLLLKWNWFDGGVNRSEVKRLDLMKKAKEAELEAILSQTNQESAFQEDGLTLAKYNLQSLDQLVEHQQSILKANESSYSEGGDITYIQMMNSFLVHEAQVRQQVHGKFDYLQKQAELYAGHTGWSSNLIKDLDRLFVKK